MLSTGCHAHRSRTSRSSFIRPSEFVRLAAAAKGGAMNSIRATMVAIAALIGSAVAASPTFANKWELTLQLVGPNAEPMQIRVCQTSTGTVIGTYSSATWLPTNDFRVDFNDTPGPGVDVSLTPGIQYTVTFIGWNKSCYISG